MKRLKMHSLENKSFATDILYMSLDAYLDILQVDYSLTDQQKKSLKRLHQAKEDKEFNRLLDNLKDERKNSLNNIPRAN